MKQVNLFRLYKLGTGIAAINLIEAGQTKGEANHILYTPELYLWAIHFEAEAAHLKGTVRAVETLIKKIHEVTKTTNDDTYKEQLTDEYVRLLKLELRLFEEAFRFEASTGNVFSVNPKGIYDTNQLIESPENRFSEKIRNLLPPQTLYDFREAGKCLAFECPTAAAFHTLRGTEALIILYYETLAGHEWDLRQRDWNAYITQLRVLGAPDMITQRLDEIRRFERNPILHPQNNIELSRALPLFEMVGGVVVLMVEEIEKLEAARAASSPSSPTSTP